MRRHGLARWSGSIPQNGTGTIFSGPLAGSTGPITGFVQISRAEINLKHQLSLIATIGRAFGNFALYAGGRSGPVRCRDEFLERDTLCRFPRAFFSDVPRQRADHYFQ